MSQCESIELDTTDWRSGACFIIMSKVRGWFIVQRDPAGMGNVIPDQTKSGWVPAGGSPYKATY